MVQKISIWAQGKVFTYLFFKIGSITCLVMGMIPCRGKGDGVGDGFLLKEYL